MLFASSGGVLASNASSQVRFVIYLTSGQSRPDIRLLVITFAAQYPSASDEFWALVLVHIILGAILPDAAIEIREFFNDGLLDEFLWDDVTSALVIVLSFEV